MESNRRSVQRKKRKASKIKLVAIAFLYIHWGMLQAQSVSQDSICKYKIDNPDEFYETGRGLDHIKKIKTSNKDNRLIVYDSENELELDGWYKTWNVLTDFYMQDYISGSIGIMPSKSYKGDRNIDAVICFDKGIPACKWTFVLSDKEFFERQYTYTRRYLFKYMHFEQGELNGNYAILSFGQTKTPSVVGDTIFKSSFKNGTGYYRNYYNNHCIQAEGSALNSYRHGRWYTFFKNSGVNERLDYREYCNGNSLMYVDFIGEESVKQRLKLAMHEIYNTDYKIPPYHDPYKDDEAEKQENTLPKIDTDSIRNTMLKQNEVFHTSYFPEGTIKTEGILQNGIKHDLWYNFFQYNGLKYKLVVEKYNLGKLISSETFFEINYVDIYMLLPIMKWELQPYKNRKGKVNPFLDKLNQMDKF